MPLPLTPGEPAMPDATRPLLALYVVWHPRYTQGAQIAEDLRQYYRREHYRNVSGDSTLSVLYRSVSPEAAPTPLSINMNEAGTTAVVVLVDSNLASESAWIRYLRELLDQAKAVGPRSQVLPVMLQPSLDLTIEVQTLRCDDWNGSPPQRRRLITELTHAFSRMLRLYLEHVVPSAHDQSPTASYLQKVQVFVSHSKHDPDGERIARAIRDWLHQHSGLSSFFDVHDIPWGAPFEQVLYTEIKRSAVVAVHTDSYSSREWCRREMIEAKLQNVPLILVDCLHDVDERAFPYMGNVPVVRMSQRSESRIDVVVARLLDEVFKDYLWRCRIALAQPNGGRVLFIPKPPELLSLARIRKDFEHLTAPTVIYPDPPLGVEEADLFERVAPDIRLLNLTRWLAENGG